MENTEGTGSPSGGHWVGLGESEGFSQEAMWLRHGGRSVAAAQCIGGGSQAAKGKLESLCHTDSPQEAFRALPTENAKCGSIGELVKKHIIYLSVLFIKLWA